VEVTDSRQGSKRLSLVNQVDSVNVSLIPGLDPPVFQMAVAQSTTMRTVMKTSVEVISFGGEVSRVWSFIFDRMSCFYEFIYSLPYDTD